MANFSDFETVAHLTLDPSRSKTWKALEVVTAWNPTIPGKEYLSLDFTGIGMSSSDIVLGKDVAEAFKILARDSIELLPIIHRDYDDHYVLVAVTNILPIDKAVDISVSDLQGAGGSYNDFRKLVFKAEPIRGLPIFKVFGMPLGGFAGCFVNEEWRKLALEFELKGTDFDLIWEGPD